MERGFFYLCWSFTGRTLSQLLFIPERPIPFPSCISPSANASSALAAPLSGNAFLPLRDLTLGEQLALWARPRGSIALSGGCTLMVRKQPAVLSCPDDLVRVWTAQPTIHQAKYLLLKTLTNKMEEIFPVRKNIQRVMENFAVRSYFVSINISFINLSSGIIIFSWWEVIIFYANSKSCEVNDEDKELCSNRNNKELAFMHLGSFYQIWSRNKVKLQEVEVAAVAKTSVVPVISS